MLLTLVDTGLRASELCALKIGDLEQKTGKDEGGGYALTRIRHWRIVMLAMIIVETSVFTRQVLELLADDEYRKLQVVLANRPNAGSLIKGSGGLRKIRWTIEGHGKRGGVRVIYYWAVKQERLLMLSRSRNGHGLPEA